MVKVAILASTSVLVAGLVSTVAAAPLSAPMGQEIEVAEREPFLPLLFGAASAIGSIFRRKRDLSGDELEFFERDLQESDLMELAEREPFLPLLFGAASAIGSIFKRKRDLSGDELEFFERDLQDSQLMELAEREPFLPLLFGAASALGSVFSRRKRDLSGDELEFFERSFDDSYVGRDVFADELMVELRSILENGSLDELD